MEQQVKAFFDDIRRNDKEALIGEDIERAIAVAIGYAYGDSKRTFSGI